MTVRGDLTTSSAISLLVDALVHLPWAQASRLAADGSATCWISVAGRSGALHVRPLLVVWVGKQPYFASGDRTGKSRALADDPRCSLAVGTELLHIVVEGTAAPVTDPGLLQQIADAYQVAHGWVVDVRDDGLHSEDGGAPTAGPPPWRVWRVDPQQAFGFPADGTLTATRWTF